MEKENLQVYRESITSLSHNLLDEQSEHFKTSRNIKNLRLRLNIDTLRLNYINDRLVWHRTVSINHRERSC